MQAQVQSDDTRRSIVIKVSAVPDIDISREYHKNRQVFRPDKVSLTFTNGALGGITVSGGMVLKSGVASDVIRKTQRWYSRADMTDLPAWLQALIEEAPAGVTSWNYPAPISL